MNYNVPTYFVYSVVVLNLAYGIVSALFYSAFGIIQTKSSLRSQRSGILFLASGIILEMISNFMLYLYTHNINLRNVSLEVKFFLKKFCI